MYDHDASIEYIDIADELRLLEALVALARDLEPELVGPAQ